MIVGDNKGCSSLLDVPAVALLNDGIKQGVNPLCSSNKSSEVLKMCTWMMFASMLLVTFGATFVMTCSVFTWTELMRAHASAAVAVDVQSAYVPHADEQSTDRVETDSYVSTFAASTSI